MAFSLSNFDVSHAPLVLSWVRSATQLAFWCSRTDHPLTDDTMFTRWHADPSVTPHLLFEDGEVVAYGEVWRDDDEKEFELARLIVASEARGRGVGQALVKHLLERLRGSAYEWVYVRVVPENRVAIACYEGAWFSATWKRWYEARFQ
ncbi:MAG: GNAT family N-acetyltransferase, partial [Pleurocapsa sp. SU_196_0]|nr:GNAT family N-acetyltransferase [Pleurocapsa sp. SU_196_0]